VQVDMIQYPGTSRNADIDADIEPVRLVYST
jgi:hypothetical protein